MSLPRTIAGLCVVVVFASTGCSQQEQDASVSIRVATFNVEDVRTDDLLRENHPRLVGIAEVLGDIRPDIVLINELAYDQEGVVGYDPFTGPGQNGARLADFLNTIWTRTGEAPVTYQAVMRPSNTGLASGYDLDNDGAAVSDFPEVPGADEDGTPGRQTEEGRAYGNDSRGFGMFPGQYAMALLVSDRLTILDNEIRTFQTFKWSDMPDALRPADPATGTFWYDDNEWADMRLSSKTHMDIPVRMPNASVVHLLCSHPTPPAFDGDEKRNQLRNHDEIRFWADYIKGAEYIVDDDGIGGGFSGSMFVILGDLNADPDEGSSYGNPIANHLFSLDELNSDFVPSSDRLMGDLDADDTAEWGLRIDYVLPSTNLGVVAGEVYRYPTTGTVVSDHFPVWLDLAIPQSDEGN